MPLSTTISLTPSIQNQVTSAAFQYSVDALVLSAIAQVMSGGQQSYANDRGGVGVMGVSLDVANSLGFDATDENQNILAGAAYMASLLGLFTGNYPFAVAAYFSGPDAVQQYNGVPPFATTQALVYNVTNLARRAGSTSMSAKNTLENQTTGDPDGAATDSGQIITPVGQSIDANNTTTALSTLPNLQIDTGLGETPWYNLTTNGSLVTGNPKIRQTVQPVAFTVYLNRTGTQFLQDPASGKPIVLQLNTSIKTFEIQSKHIFNRQPSRTGMHITLWGMNPDLITGSGSTGVFMNQFGLTDFFSVADVNDDIKTLVTSGFGHKFASNVSAGTQQSTGSVLNFTSGQVTGGTASDPTTQQFNTIIGKRAVDPQTAFRVAAQDAFIEFLKLFQMNGMTWFFSQNYKGSYTGQSQQGPNAWSEALGASSFEQTARNNDVATRGFVAMRFRNNIYLGYFKSLTWTQDAEKPFSWDFNFVFQVEKTVSSLYWPNAGVTQFSNIGQAVVAGITSGQPPVEPTASPIEGKIE